MPITHFENQAITLTSLTGLFLIQTVSCDIKKSFINKRSLYFIKFTLELLVQILHSWELN